MKKIISLALVGVMALSMVPTALATTDYTNGTKVEYVGQGSAQYTIAVPALLSPGGEGNVTLQGTWASDETVKVTADKTVTLTNSINANDQKVLDVTFAGIEKAGDNTKTVQAVETVSVSDISNALFGTWSGKFNYNVEILNEAVATLGCDTLYWDGNVDGMVKTELDGGSAVFAKVSDIILTTNNLENATVTYSTGDQLTNDGTLVSEINGIISFADSIYIATIAGATYNDFTLPEAGIYFLNIPDGNTYVTSFTIPGYTGFQHSEHCGH